MKISRLFYISIIFLLSMTFSSCYFFSSSEDQFFIENSYYIFDNYDAMVDVTVPLINKNFTNWHWSSEKFDLKYETYYDNVNLDSKSLSYLEKYSKPYSVYIGKGSLTTKEKSTISGTYFLITQNTDDGQVSTVFYRT